MDFWTTVKAIVVGIALSNVLHFVVSIIVAALVHLYVTS